MKSSTAEKLEDLGAMPRLRPWHVDFDGQIIIGGDPDPKPEKPKIAPFGVTSVTDGETEKNCKLNILDVDMASQTVWIKATNGPLSAYTSVPLSWCKIKWIPV